MFWDKIGMLVSRCPRCDESVLIPDAWLSRGRGGSAQCPWCVAEIDIADVRRALPPMLVMLDETDDDLQLAGAGAGMAELDVDGFDTVIDPAGVTGSVASMAAMRTSSHTRPGSAREPLMDEIDEFESIDPGDDDGRDLDELTMRPVVEAGERVRKDVPIMMDIDAGRHRTRRRSPVRTILGFMAGPPLALGIFAGFCYITDRPLPNLGFPPFDGTRLDAASRYLAATPANLPPLPKSPPSGRSLAEDLPSSADENSETTAELPSRRLDVAEGPGFRMPEVDLSMPEPKKPEPVDATPDFSIVGIPLDAANPLDDETRGTMTRGSAMPDLPGADLPGADLPDSDLPDSDLSMEDLAVSDADEPAMTEMPLVDVDAVPEMSPPISPPTNADLFALADFQVLVDAADEAITKLLSLNKDDEAWQPTVTDTFKTMSELAAELDTIAAPDADTLKSVDDLLRRVRSSEPLIRGFALETTAWLTRPDADRPNRGCWFVGKFNGGEQKLTLGGGKVVPVQLPDTMTDAPSGIQVGLATILDDGGLAIVRVVPLGG